MCAIKHHPSEALLAAYAAGNLDHVFSIVIASHISMCLDCRASVEAHQAVGGMLLDDTPQAAVSDDLRSNVMALLDKPVAEPPVFGRKGIYPGPVVQALNGAEPVWKPIGLGVRQSVVSSDAGGTVRLLHIPPGQSVPDHSHNGLELTLVLQGSFHDETGRFGVGDLEVADESVEHMPVAGQGAPCVCLAATDARLRFSSFLPRMAQVVIGI